MAWCAELLSRRRTGRRPALIFIPIDHNKSLRSFVATQVRHPLMRGLVAWDAFKAGRLEDCAIKLVDGVVVLTNRDKALFMADHPDAEYLLVQPGYTGGIVPTRRIDATVPERICVLGGPWHLPQANRAAAMSGGVAPPGRAGRACRCGRRYG